jgi:hypothetical protein
MLCFIALHFAFIIKIFSQFIAAEMLAPLYEPILNEVRFMDYALWPVLILNWLLKRWIFSDIFVGLSG